jgi:hypothetical protein
METPTAPILEPLSEAQELEFMRIAYEFQRISAPIVNYELPRHQREIYFKFISLINDELTVEPLTVYFGQKSVMGSRAAIESSFASLTIAKYHQDRLCKIESDLVHAFRDFLINDFSAIGGGNAHILDAEYQAFILSCRRCLDQLVYGITQALKQEGNSFRKFAKQLRGTKNQKLAMPILEVYELHREKFNGWLIENDEKKKSIRDQIAHYKSVRAGTLNVTARGVFVAGIEGPRDLNGHTLTQVSATLMNDTRLCFDELLSTFVQTAVLEIGAKETEDQVAEGAEG